MRSSLIAAGIALMVASGCGESVPERSQVAGLAAGYGHTCALLADGSVRCFGRNEFGQLGLGHTEPIGDDEWPIEGGVVALPERAVAVAGGGNHSCAIGVSGSLYCWGQNTYGQLGLGHRNGIGDDEPVGAASRVPFADRVASVALGGLHSCVVLEGGSVRCFGDGTNGQLGYASTEDIGDDETVAAAPDVELGGSTAALAAGLIHTCSLDAAGAVHCWGRGEPPLATAPGGWGQLGYGNRENIGDDETPASAGTVDVGGPVAALAAGHVHQCALLESGAVRCWGRGEGKDNYGQLGIAMEENVGDDEPASAAGDIAIGEPAASVSAGDVHTCAVTRSGGLRCFGFAGFGQLGYGNQEDIGDDEFPDAAGDVPVGGTVLQVVTGTFHTCALLEGGLVRCFGLAAGGEIGSGSTENIGDDELAADVEPIVL